MASAVLDSTMTNHGGNPLFEETDTLSDIDDIEDVRLMNHNQRFQAAVLRTMEKQLSAMEDQIETKEYDLKMNERAREDLGVAFGQLKTEIHRVNGLLGKANSARQEAEQSATISKIERDKAFKDFEKLETEKNELQLQVSDLLAKLTIRNEMLAKDQKVQQMLSSDIKMHRLQKETYEKELGHDKLVLQQKVEEQEDLRKKFESSVQQVLLLKEELSAQESQTKQAQTVCEKLVKEVELVKAQNDVLVHQFKAASINMKRRDETLEMLAQTTEKAVEKQSELTVIKSKLFQENDGLLHDKDAMEVSLNQARDKIQLLNRRLVQEQQEHLDEQQQSAALLNQVDKLEKVLLQTNKDLHKKVAEAQLWKDRHTAAVSETREVKEKYQDLQVDQSKSEARSQQHLEKLETTFAKSLQDANAVIINLDHDRQKTLYKATEVSTLLKKMTLQHNAMETEFKSVLKLYQNMCEENRNLEGRCERFIKTNNDLALQNSILRQKRADDYDEELKAAVARVQDADVELQDKKQAFQDVQNKIRDTEDAFWKAQQLNQQHTAKQQAAVSAEQRAERLINKNMQERLHKDIAALEKEQKEVAVELNLSNVQVRQRDKQLLAAEEEIKKLKEQLDKAGQLFKLKQKSYDHDVQVLRAENARQIKLREKNDTIPLLQNSEKDRLAKQRKIEMLEAKLVSADDRTKKYAQMFFDLKKQTKLLLAEQSTSSKQQADWEKQFGAVYEKEIRKRQAMTTALRRKAASQPLIPPLNSSSSSSTHQLSNSKPASAGVVARHPTEQAFAAAVASSSSSSSSSSGTAEAPNRGASPRLTRLVDKNNLSQTARVSSKRTANKKTNSVPFLDTLVHELRKQLNRVSTVAAERLNEIVKLKQLLKHYARANTAGDEKEQGLKDVLMDVQGERMQLQREVINHYERFVRAETLAASLEKQLKQVLAAAANHPDVCDYCIDYSHRPDLEVSEELKTALNKSLEPLNKRALKNLWSRLADRGNTNSGGTGGGDSAMNSSMRLNSTHHSIVDQIPASSMADFIREVDSLSR